MGDVVDDRGKVCGAVKLHLRQTLLVGLDHTLYAYKTEQKVLKYESHKQVGYRFKQISVLVYSIWNWANEDMLHRSINSSDTLYCP